MVKIVGYQQIKLHFQKFQIEVARKRVQHQQRSKRKSQACITNRTTLATDPESLYNIA